MASLCDPRWEAGQQSGWKDRRDPRHKILLRARMRSGGLPADVCIRDISRRGACIVSGAPPVRGTVVELTGGHMPIVGRVVWVTGQRFGIEVRGSIDVAAFVARRNAPAGVAPHDLVPPPGTPGFSRVPAKLRSDSRHAGNAMQFLFVAFLAGCAAAFLGMTVYENLSRTVAVVETGLGGGG